MFVCVGGAAITPARESIPANFRVEPLFIWHTYRSAKGRASLESAPGGEPARFGALLKQFRVRLNAELRSLSPFLRLPVRVSARVLARIFDTLRLSPIERAFSKIGETCATADVLTHLKQRS